MQKCRGGVTEKGRKTKKSRGGVMRRKYRGGGHEAKMYGGGFTKTGAKM